MTANPHPAPSVMKSTERREQSILHPMLNKVPEVTIFFWIIKVLCTTVGETAADFLADNLGFGLSGTSLVMGVLLVLGLYFQFSARKYIPSIYWLVVVFISIAGTLITDNLTDNFGVSLVISTLAFAMALAAAFAIWYKVEHTLSIHTIFTRRREAFYWTVILLTFALGTAAGDLIAERFSLGYGWSLVLFAGLIAAVVIWHWQFNLNPVLAFWAAYILTRPLGASIGDLLSQSRDDGGMGIGTTATTAVFLGSILILVTYLTISGVDQIPPSAGIDS